MKRAFKVGFLAAVLLALPVISMGAGEHGGQEHGGKEHGGTASPAASKEHGGGAGAVTSADLQVLSDAANALEDSRPSLAAKLRDLHHKLGGR